MPTPLIITLTQAGEDTGPFNIYSNIDGYTVPFESGVSKGDLTSGYVSTLVPDTASIVRVKSDNPLCSNYIDLVIPTTTTTTTLTPPTTSTTTTSAPITTTTTTTVIANVGISINNNITGLEDIEISSISFSHGKTFTLISGVFPIDQSQGVTGTVNGEGTFDITLNITVNSPGSDPSTIKVTDSNGITTCKDITTTASYVFVNQAVDESTPLVIVAEDGSC